MHTGVLLHASQADSNKGEERKEKEVNLWEAMLGVESRRGCAGLTTRDLYKPSRSSSMTPLFSMLQAAKDLRTWGLQIATRNSSITCEAKPNACWSSVASLC